MIGLATGSASSFALYNARWRKPALSVDCWPIIRGRLTSLRPFDFTPDSRRFQSRLQFIAEVISNSPTNTLPLPARPLWLRTLIDSLTGSKATQFRIQWHVRRRHVLLISFTFNCWRLPELLHILLSKFKVPLFNIVFLLTGIMCRPKKTKSP